MSKCSLIEGKNHAAMVPSLVLFKVMEISRKKRQMRGFYIQIKNILITFPQKIFWLWSSFPKNFMIIWCSTDFYHFGRFIHKLCHISLIFSFLIEMELQLNPQFKGKFLHFEVFFLQNPTIFWKKNKFGSLKNLQNTFETGVFFTEL